VSGYDVSLTCGAPCKPLIEENHNPQRQQGNIVPNRKLNML